MPASFEIDLWGRLARAEEAVRANLLQTEENRRTVAQTVVAETVTLYLQMESLERGIDIDKKLIESFRRSLNLVESRYKRGLTSVLDVRQARRVLAGAEATLPAQVMCSPALGSVESWAVAAVRGSVIVSKATATMVLENMICLLDVDAMR